MNKFVKYFVSFALVITVLLSTSLIAFAADDEYMAEHGEEGRKLWEDVVQALSPVLTATSEHDYEWWSMIRIWDLDEESVKEYGYSRPDFLDVYPAYTYRTQKELDELSSYELLLWDIAALGIERDILYSGAINSYEDWYDAYYRYIVSPKFSRLSNSDERKKTLLDACEAYMEWSWNYYHATGCIYNFIENKDSLDYIHERYDTESDKESDTKDTEDSASSVSSFTSMVSSTSSENSTVSVITSTEQSVEKRGIWGSVLYGLRKSWFTLLIIVVLGGVLAYKEIIKRKYNMDDDDE